MTEAATQAAPLRPTRNMLQPGLLRSALPAKTRFGFVAATLTILLIAFLSYRTSLTRSEGARLVTHTMDVTRRLELLLSLIKDAETGQRGFLLTAAERYLTPYEEAVAALPGELARMRTLIADNPEQMERLSALERLAADKMAELKQTVELGRSRRREDALALLQTDRGKTQMDQIRRTVAEMKGAEQDLLQTRSQQWEQASALSLNVVWAGSALLFLLIAGAALLSARDFRELWRVGWLRAGQNEISAGLQGPQTVESLGYKIAGLLCGHLDAQVGAVYFAAARGGLQRVGGFALPDPPPEESEPRPPAGLTKQAFQQNALIEARAVPEDFFPVSSGLGQGRARHLLVAPLTADGAPNGAVELGFLRAPLPHDVELLRRVAEPIGIALRSAKYRRELEDVLAETQRQAEQLQTQQEELRVQNEELEQQGRVLQDSQARLENQQAELEQINANLEEQTRTLERQRNDLARAQGELQRASAYKSEFLANMSHELRTPLNSSLILAKLLADNREGNLTTEQVKFAETIYSAGNDLLTLINDILDLSKIEAGKLDVRAEEVSLRRLTEELMDVFRPVAREKGIEVDSAIDGGAPGTIVTDWTRVQQILKNLLSNAVKFTERGGVFLRVRPESDGRVAFDVKDTGIGIPAEQHQVIFEAFRQADGTANRKFGGTGLGLSISRDLSHLLGGELKLESAPGRGSTFTLSLPARLPETPARTGTAAAASPAGGQPALRPAPPAAVPAAKPNGSVAERKLGPRSLLVIEDDRAFAAVLEDLAREVEFDVLLATSGEEGLALARRHLPSAIVLDVGLPDRSGLSVLDALKHTPATRHIPVHVVSAFDYAQPALEMGAAGYAIKPVKREDLVGALQRLESRFTRSVRRLLVVEDDAVARDSTCRLLQAPDVETVAVGSAADALAELSRSTFDCMVLDLTLPDRSGLDLLEEISGKQTYGFPPVIVYTGRSLSRREEQQLQKLSRSIIIKGARSPERLLDEVTLFLHQVESDLPADKRRMLEIVRHREAVFEGRRILVVEDDVRNVFALTSVLEPRGARVEIARNGREALAHLKGGVGADLVLMDIMMPEMDGLEATREIRKLPQFAKLPIIALTAKAMLDDREQCLTAGANDYIAKPLDVEKLLSLARVWMAK